MAVRRISLEEASKIPDTQLVLFENTVSGRAFLRQGQYYAIVADSPDRGVLISDKPLENFKRADQNYNVGKLVDFEGSATMIFYSTE